MSRRVATLVVSSVLASVLAGIAFILPVPYVGLSPGSPYNTLGAAPQTSGRMIDISGVATYPDADGRLDFTVVSVSGKCSSGLTLGDAVTVWFDRDAAVVPKSVVCPPDIPDDEVEKRVAEEMQASQDSAITAALVHLRLTSVSVQTVVPGSPAALGGLKPGDVLRTVDTVEVRNPEELRAQIGKRAVGGTVRIGLTRGDKPLELTIGTVAATDDGSRPTIGIDPKIETKAPFAITINTDPVGGPSAGLMLSLGIIELLGPESLTGGAHVAGTGTITDDGVVGPIGGIHQKLVGARDKGATHFLVPKDNWDAAQRSKPDGLTLHQVATLDDALAALAKIRAAKG